MPIAMFKDLCLDARDASVVGSFWAAALGQHLDRSGPVVCARGPHFPALWFDEVPDTKVVKNRVHLDLHVPDLASLIGLGASILAEHDDWAVLADPEGNEFCAFPGERGDGAPATGAPIVRARDAEIGWTVMADPQGNEFCVFVAP